MTNAVSFKVVETDTICNFGLFNVNYSLFTIFISKGTRATHLIETGLYVLILFILQLYFFTIFDQHKLEQNDLRALTL